MSDGSENRTGLNLAELGYFGVSVVVVGGGAPGSLFGAGGGASVVDGVLVVEGESAARFAAGCEGWNRRIDGVRAHRMMEDRKAKDPHSFEYICVLRDSTSAQVLGSHHFDHSPKGPYVPSLEIQKLVVRVKLGLCLGVF